ncbi:MAG: tRNA pseudouridine(55) synthase TruB [Acidobacteriota bacterium]|nr:tRNA pseudouridine(55) synthase TruB [Acidobacteriota bacterium]
MFPDGVLVVDKTQGPTSHDVVTLARRALGVSRIGHTGTLDPMATGVLPLVVGRATRLAQFLTAGDKDYEATVAFGRTTDTYDALGKAVTQSDARPDRDQLEAAVTKFRGTFEQTPPAYSAKNIDGTRSYELARKMKTGGVATLPKAVIVTARQLEIVSFDGETACLRMSVTAGFYVRSLAHDLGAALGMGAVLAALRRTRSGEFGLEGAVPLADVLQSSRETLAGWLVPFDGLLAGLPSVTLRGPAHVERVKNGLEVAPEDLLAAVSPLPELVRLLGPDGALVGLAKPGRTPGFLHAAVVLA